MSDRVALERAISDIFERKLYLTVPSPSADLFESGSLDSLSFLELLLQLELEYKLRIPLQELGLANFRSIESIAAFIQGRLEAEPQAARPCIPAGKHVQPPAVQSRFAAVSPAVTVIESIFDEPQAASPAQAVSTENPFESIMNKAQASPSKSTPQYTYMEAKCQV